LLRPEEEIDKGKAALTELFNSVEIPTRRLSRSEFVADIDAIV
jgi:hypothetical protein